MTAGKSDAEGATSSTPSRAIGCILLPIAIVLSIAYWEQIKELHWYWLAAIVAGYVWLLGTLKPSEDKQREEEMRNAVAKTLSQQGKHQQAFQASVETLQSFPENVEALYIQGLSSFHLGNVSQAESIWEKVLERSPSHWLAANNLGSVSLNRGDYLRAARYYAAARKAGVTDPDLDDNIATIRQALATEGRAVERSRNYTLALEYANALVEIDPAFALAYAFRASQHFSLRQFEAATEDARKCLELDPNYQPAKDILRDSQSRLRQSVEIRSAANNSVVASRQTLQKSEPVADALWQVGEEVFGRFKVERIIESGGMGRIYLGWDSQACTTMVLKTIKQERQSDDSTRLFQFEAEHWFSLGDHPNIVTLYSVEKHQHQHLVLAMEYIAGAPGIGPTLREHLDQKERVPEAQACQYAIGICQAMEYAIRAQQLVHRDLKPENVFITSSDTVKVGDFGIAVTEGTVVHSPGGTPSYMAPEQFEVDIAVTLQVDIYAIGVILFELLCGRRPFVIAEKFAHARQAFQYTEYERMHREEPAPNVQSFSPETHSEVSSIILKCLAKDPSDRFESFSDLRDALAPFVSSTFSNITQTTADNGNSRSAQSYDRGVSLDSLGHLPEALDCYRKAVTREPFKSKRSEAWCNMGKVLGTMDRTKEALEAFDRAVAIDFKDVHAHFGRANSLARMTKNEEALSALDTVKELDAKYLDGYVCRGGILYAMGENKNAEQAFQTALELEPEYPYALNGLGLCAEAASRRDDAIVFFERALVSDPNCEPAEENLTRLRHVSEASVSTDQAGQAGASDDTENAISLMNLGITYGNDGRFEEAREHLARAVRLDPQNGYAFLGLARACGALSRFDEAAEYGLRAAELGQPEGTHIAQTAQSMKRQ